MTFFIQVPTVTATANTAPQPACKAALRSVGDDKTSYNGNQLGRVICVTAPQIKAAG